MLYVPAAGRGIGRPLPGNRRLNYELGPSATAYVVIKCQSNGYDSVFLALCPEDRDSKPLNRSAFETSVLENKS